MGVVGGSSVRPVATCQAVCDHWSTREQSERLGRSGALVGDGTWLTLGEAVTRLKAAPKPVPISYSTLRRMAESGEIPTTRVGRRRDRWVPAKAIDALKAEKWAEGHPEEGQDEAGPGPEEEHPDGQS